jgi:hypothetical protein
MAITARNYRGGVTPAVTGSERGRRNLGRKELTGGACSSARKREEAGTPVREGLDGPRAGFEVGPKSFPRPFYLFFFPSLFFPFSVFYFFCIFCKKASIQFKPLSEIF